MAPLLGWTVDVGINDEATSVEGFWPVAALGVFVSLVALIHRSRIRDPK